MSAEGPVRKPSNSEPPDVDSLMSRLDGDESGDRISDPGGERRPSAAELLGGRGRRTKRTIRVPDDAVPGAAPPSMPVRRSNPPPPLGSTGAPSAPTAPMPAAPMPAAATIVQPVEPPRDLPKEAAPELIARPSFVPDEQLGRITPQRIISVGEGPPPVFPALRTAPAASFIPVSTSEPTAPSEPPSEVVPLGHHAPPSDVRAAVSPEKIRPLTVPNLDAQVREALALLDREDFEVPVDISDAEDDPKGPPPSNNEENLGEEELEVVDQTDQPVPSKKVVTAPNPPPRRAGSSVPNQAVGNTLPSAAPEHNSQPAIVVAAAATVSSAPAATAMSAAPAVGATLPSSAATDSAEVKKKKRQWFEELFNDDFQRTLPKADARYLEREVRFIEDALGCDKGATILDLGCGPGEQAVALASRGYEVIGIDLSLAMLARAADEAAEKSQRINFLQGDMRDLTFDDAFDGIYCWGTTFGYFDDIKNAEVIQKIHKALRRGGRFLLDVVNRDYIAARMPSMVWFEGEGCVCMDEAQLNGITSRLIVKRTMMMEDGRQREIEYSIRLYALHELGKVLHDNGFRIAEASGDTSTPGKYFGSESPRILILAEKR